MKVVQVFEVGIIIEGDDQTEPASSREFVEEALRRHVAQQNEEHGTNWPVATTVTFKSEFLRRKDRHVST